VILKILIADDNLGSRLLVRDYLSKVEGIEIAGEAASGDEALSLAKKLRPDVIFLDVDMPGQNGIEVARELIDIFPDIYIVFITAYPDYALEAFELYSFDYILKPIDEERVVKTINRIGERSKGQEAELAGLLKAFTKPNRLSIKKGHEFIFIDIEDVIFIEKNNKKTIIHTVKGHHDTYETLNDIEKRLQGKTFFRSHKSYLINLKMVDRIIPWANGSYLIKFRNTNSDAILSRSQAKMLPEVL